MVFAPWTVKEFAQKTWDEIAAKYGTAEALAYTSEPADRNSPSEYKLADAVCHHYRLLKRNPRTHKLLDAAKKATASLNFRQSHLLNDVGYAAGAYENLEFQCQKARYWNLTRPDGKFYDSPYWRGDDLRYMQGYGLEDDLSAGQGTAPRLRAGHRTFEYKY